MGEGPAKLLQASFLVHHFPNTICSFSSCSLYGPGRVEGQENCGLWVSRPGFRFSSAFANTLLWDLGKGLPLLGLTFLMSKWRHLDQGLARPFLALTLRNCRVAEGNALFPPPRQQSLRWISLLDTVYILRWNRRVTLLFLYCQWLTSVSV